MKKLFGSLSIPVLLMMLTTSAQAGAKEEINDLLDGFHKAASTGSYNDYFDRYAEDSVFLGTDKSERWTIEEFKDYAKPAFEKGGWHYDVVERHVMFGENHAIAWFDEILDNAGFGKCRGTGVVVKTEGVWKIAHYSLTLLIPNDIAHAVGEQSIRADMPQPTSK